MTLQLIAKSAECGCLSPGAAQAYDKCTRGSSIPRKHLLSSLGPNAFGLFDRHGSLPHSCFSHDSPRDVQLFLKASVAAQDIVVKAENEFLACD